MIASKNYVEVQERGTGITGQIARRHYFFPISDFAIFQNQGLFPNTVIDTPAGYDANDTLWDTLAGPANELRMRASTTSRIRGYPNPYEAKEYRTETGGLERRDFAYVIAANSAEVCHEVTTRLDAAPALTSGSVTYYDGGTGNGTDLYEFDFGITPPVATVADATRPEYVRATCPVQTSLAGYLRHTNISYLTSADYVSPPTHLPSLASQVLVRNSSAATVGQTDFDYDEAVPDSIAGLMGWQTPAGSKRGNATSVKQLVKDLWTENGFNVTAHTIEQKRKYDIAGNLIEVQDPLLQKTTYKYTDACEGGTPGSTIAAFLTSVEFPMTYHKTSWRWDCYLGRPVSFTDRDGTTTSFKYEAAATQLSRLEKVTAPTGATTNFVDGDTPGSIKVIATSDQYGSADGRKVSETQYDGLGRPISILAMGDTQQVVTSNEYDALGRRWRTHGPMFLTDSDTFDEFTYDALGRVLSVVHSADGSTASRTYVGDKITILDEAQKKSCAYTRCLWAVDKGGGRSEWSELRHLLRI